MTSQFWCIHCEVWVTRHYMDEPGQAEWEHNRWHEQRDRLVNARAVDAELAAHPDLAALDAALELWYS